MDETLRLWKEAYARHSELKAARRAGQRPPSQAVREMKLRMRACERSFRATRQEWQAMLERFTDAPAGQGF